MLAALTTQGCVGSNAVGVRPDPLPQNVAAQCAHPLDVVRSVRGRGVGADEVRMGRLGDALLKCRAEKQIAVDAYVAVGGIVAEGLEK